MKVAKNTLELEIDEWSDPGDYPNAVAQFALPSYNYVSGVIGELVIELESGDEGYASLWSWVHNLVGWPEYFMEDVEETASEELPSEVSYVTWHVTRVGNVLTLEVDEFEADMPEPDYD